MIRVENLNMTVGRFALEDVSLHVRPGEYFVLLGPTGSGKTLLIETICGLNRARSGRIIIDGLDMTRREPRHRRLGYVPQDYALFPQQTVLENIAYGLEPDRLWLRIPRCFVRALLVRPAQRLRVPAYLAKTLLIRPGRRLLELATHRRWAERRPQTLWELMELVGVRHLADRLPERLSGGEKQRVALARALAIRPQVMLLDEPVSALDEETREAVCRQLKRVQHDTGTTMVHICHNFTEMLAVADRAGIIVDGRILQVGTPQEILQRPCNTRVARFVQAGNLFRAVARADGPWLKLVCGPGLELRVKKPDAPVPDGTELSVMVRPEDVRLAAARPSAPPPETIVLDATVTDVTDQGPVVNLHVSCGPGPGLVVSLGKRHYRELRPTAGDRVPLLIDCADVHVMRE